MASLKECKARAKKLGHPVTVVKHPSGYDKEHNIRYKFMGVGCRTVKELSKFIRSQERAEKRKDFHKLNGYRLPGGYKMVKRKKIPKW